ncbi:hypothetical protein [Streptomyces sp. NPDC000229]|uniref:hypothetical protein n=1 Tax=Streptomyces sp. NPDC000229 TaxID=3154247 RepID=UPI003320A63E
MPIDPFAALNALIRAEATRSADAAPTDAQAPDTAADPHHPARRTAADDTAGER